MLNEHSKIEERQLTTAWGLLSFPSEMSDCPIILDRRISSEGRRARDILRR